MENNKINEGALTKRIKTLVLQERYEEARKELDEIDEQDSQHIHLRLVGEVYMDWNVMMKQNGFFFVSMRRIRNTRRILDLLTTLYIDKGEYSGSGILLQGIYRCGFQRSASLYFKIQIGQRQR